MCRVRRKTLVYHTIPHTSSHAVLTNRTYRVDVACFGQEHVGNQMRCTGGVSKSRLVVPMFIFVSPILHR